MLLPWAAAILVVPAIAVSALAATNPQTPTGLTATTPTPSAPALRWNPANGASSYVVYRGSTAVVNTRSTSFTDTGVRTSGAYTYTVRGYRDGRLSSPSAPFTVLVDMLRPGTVGALSGTSPTNGSPTLTWAATADSGGSGVKRYEVSRNGTLVGTPASPSFTDTGATAEGSYGYTVVAVDGAGNRSQTASPVKTIVVDRTSPTVPGTPAAAQSETASAPSLTWAASSDASGVAAYRILRSGTQVGTSTGTSFTDSALRASSTYTYTVIAVDAAGNSSPASGGTTVTYDATPPPVPTGLAGSASGGTVTLSWSAVDDGGSTVSYRVFRGGTAVATTAATTLDDAPGDGTFSYTVASIDRLGNVSAQSAPVTVTLTTAPSDTTAPTTPLGVFALARSAANGGGNIISWALSTDSGTGVASYQIFRGGDLVGTGDAPPFNAGTAGIGAYTVKAVDGAGNTSAASLPADAQGAFATGIGARLTTDQSAPEYALHPHLEIIALMLRWNQVQPSPGVFNWGNLDASLAHARDHGYKLIIRIMCGADAPAWLATDSANPVDMLDLLSTEPNNPRYKGELFMPVPWDPDLAVHYGRLLDALNAHLVEGSWAPYVEFVPIAMPTMLGSEMQIGYGSGTYTGVYKGVSGTYNRATVNRAEWDAHAPSGSTSNEKQQANRDALEQAWHTAIDLHMNRLSVPSALAYGALLGDVYAAAQRIAASEISPARDNLWSMTTNLQPKVRADGTLGPWSEWNPQAAQTIRIALQNGGIIGFQSPGSGIIDTPAKVQAMVDDGIDNYNMRFLETASETIDAYDGILISNAGSAQARLQARFGRG
jgi:fibronectin type 3 domain-containing protein